MLKHFDCEECGAHGKITFHETVEIASQDVAYCPFCGADIFAEEDIEDNE